MGAVTASPPRNANVMYSAAIWKFNWESTFNKSFLLSDRKVFFQNGPICVNCRQAWLFCTVEGKQGSAFYRVSYWVDSHLTQSALSYQLSPRAIIYLVHPEPN